MDVNEAIVKILEDCGRVDYVFGSSGKANASMMLALKESEKLETIIVRNEQAASFMACGYTMFNPGNLGVCFATGGPGAFNLFQGIAVAYSDSLPVLAITGYVSKDQRGKGVLNESSGLNRTPNSHAMFSATTKKSYIVEDASQICDIMEDAINTAFNGRPGPVHVHVPKDVSVSEVENFRSISFVIKEYKPKKENVYAVSKYIADALKDNKNIVLLAGYGCLRAEAREELVKFAENYDIPFMTTMDAKGYLPEDHRLSLGVFGTAGDPLAQEYFDKADIVVAVGNSFAENATFSFKPDLYEGKTLIHINIDKNEIGKVYNADLGICADARLAFEAINAVLEKIAEKKSRETVTDKSKRRINMPDEPAKTENRMQPADVARVISETIPENAIVLGDAGNHMIWLNSYMSLNKNQRYQNPGSFGPMASHTNGCIGVKCANPDKVVIAGSGDGCYLMAGFELITAVVHNIPVVWVIFNNGDFNVVKKSLLNTYGKYAYMEVPNPDYCKYAEACGAKAFSVRTKEEFKNALDKAIKLNEPVIIDAHVDSEVYPPMNT